MTGPAEFSRTHGICLKPIGPPLNYNIYVPLCVGGSKVKAGIHLKYYSENRDTFKMYPGKVMHMIGG